MVEVISAFLRGLDEVIMLWLLSSRPRHGYGLIKEFRRLTGYKLKPGIVYPFLRWLEEEGFAVGRWVKNGGRDIKYYLLTSKGESLLSKVRELFSKPIREVVMDLLFKKKNKN